MKCPVCGSSRIRFNEDTAEYVCVDCGVVVEDSLAGSFRLPERYQFVKSQADDPIEVQRFSFDPRDQQHLYKLRHFTEVPMDCLLRRRPIKLPTYSAKICRFTDGAVSVVIWKRTEKLKLLPKLYVRFRRIGADTAEAELIFNPFGDSRKVRIAVAGKRVSLKKLAVLTAVYGTTSFRQGRVGYIERTLAGIYALAVSAVRLEIDGQKYELRGVANAKVKRRFYQTMYNIKKKRPKLYQALRRIIEMEMND